MTDTVRLTAAQAIVSFLANQVTERDGAEQRLFVGCFGARMAAPDRDIYVMVGDGPT